MAVADKTAITLEDVEAALRTIKMQMTTAERGKTAFNEKAGSFGSPVSRPTTMLADLEMAVHVLGDLVDAFDSISKNHEVSSETTLSAK